MVRIVFQKVEVSLDLGHEHTSNGDSRKSLIGPGPHGAKHVEARPSEYSQGVSQAGRNINVVVKSRPSQGIIALFAKERRPHCGELVSAKMPSFFSRMLSSSSNNPSKKKQSREEAQAQAAEAFLAQGDQRSPATSSTPRAPGTSSSGPLQSSSGPSRPVPIPRQSASKGQASSNAAAPQSARSHTSSAGESVDTSDMNLAEHTAQYGSSPSRAPHKSPLQKAQETTAGSEATEDTEDAPSSRDDNNSPDDDLIDVSELAHNLPQPQSRNGHPAPPTTQAILANPSPSGAATQQQAQRSLLAGSSANVDGARAFDLDNMIARLLAVGYSGKSSKSPPLKVQEITAICQAAREVFMAQPAFLELSAPVKVVGDIHGQYSDLIRLFEMTGYPPEANFLFLGDYVDRGKQSRSCSAFCTLTSRRLTDSGLHSRNHSPFAVLQD